MSVSCVMEKTASLSIKKRSQPISFVKSLIGNVSKRAIMIVIMVANTTRKSLTRNGKNDIITIGTNARMTKATILMLLK